MFNFFKNITRGSGSLKQPIATDDTMSGNKETTELLEPKVIYFDPRLVEPSVAEPRDDTYDEAPYTIGLNNAGMTQLRVKNSVGATTLTMNEHAVRQMIRQLESTLDEYTDDE